ncbi:MAG TPA: NrfD/PsrC family molybdoenzyme membrane anchor subunit [Balneolales bacterium]|jgi:formate-dependent nitrite reductase membrane component NrfD|nr:NrfD/PsrC family molybdoenzyme membrane anchor subunit [Balneolales bacterium]
MDELTITRHNELIDPTLHIWGWQIPVYLFIGGLVAGMMIISGYFLFKGRTRETKCSCFYLPVLSVIFLSLGMLALFLDLEHKLHFWRLYTTFKITSPMSWGAWILLLVYPALILNMIIRLPDFILERFPKLGNLTDRVNEHPYAIKNIGVFNMVLGAMLGVYTGILLSTLTGRPLWNTSILGILFLVSGLSSAAAFVHMIARDVYERELLAKADNGFLSLELIVVAMFFIGILTSSASQKTAATLLLSGPFAAVFWVFVIGIGMVIPLFIQLMAVNHKIKHTPVAPIMVIAGGVLLRFVFVYAGEYSHWLIHAGLVR